MNKIHPKILANQVRDLIRTWM